MTNINSTITPTSRETQVTTSYPPCSMGSKSKFSTPTPSVFVRNILKLNLPNNLTLIEYIDGFQEIPRTDSGCFYLPRDRVTGTEININNSYQILIKSIDAQNELVTVLQHSKKVYETDIRTATYSGLQEAWGYENHWIIEVMTVKGVDIIQDGESLKTKNNYEQAFAFQLLNDKPFYFFEKLDSGFGVNYNNVEIPLDYDDIPYLNFAPGSGGSIFQYKNMVSFTGVKNGTRHPVDLGIFKP